MENFRVFPALPDAECQLRLREEWQLRCRPRHQYHSNDEIGKTLSAKRSAVNWLTKLLRPSLVTANNNSIAAGRDVNVYQTLSQQIGESSTALPTYIDHRITRFIEYHVGTPGHRVPFGGRDAQIFSLNTWLVGSSENNNNLLITAPMGRGKTSLLLHWIAQKDGEIPVVFVPINIVAGLAKEVDFYHAFSIKLAIVLEEQLNSGWVADPTTFYRNQVIEQIGRIQNSGKRCLIVVDGLDEADWRLDPAALPLSRVPTLKIVAGARVLVGDEGPMGWCRRLQWNEPPNTCTGFDLPALDEPGVRDVLQKSVASGSFPFATVSLAPELFRLSEGGDPLLLRLYLDEMRENGSHIQATELSKQEPGYRAFFAHCWTSEQHADKATQHTSDVNVTQAILAVLCSTRGPIRLSELDHIIRSTAIFGIYRPISQQSLYPIRRWIIGDGTKVGLSLSHPRLREYFRIDHFGDGAVIKAVDTAILEWGRCTLHCLRSGEISATANPAYEYLLRHYLEHLVAAPAPIDHFLELVDGSWMHAWRMYEQSYRGFANEVSMILTILQQATSDPNADTTSLVASQIRCVLCLTSIFGLGSEAPPSLLSSAVQADVITIAEAIHLAELRTSENRGLALEAIFSSLSYRQQRTALEYIKSLSAPTRELILLRLMPELDNELQNSLLFDIFGRIIASTDLRQYDSTLPKLIPLLTGDRRSKIIELAFKIAHAEPDPASRAIQLLTLCEFVPTEESGLLRYHVLALLGSLDVGRRSDFLVLLVDKFPPNLRPAVAEMALHASNLALEHSIAQAGSSSPQISSAHDISIKQKNVAVALAKTALSLPENLREAAFTEAIQRANKIPMAYRRVGALLTIASDLTEQLQSDVLTSCLKEVLLLPSANNRLHSLTRLIPMLGSGERELAIRKAFDAAEIEAIEIEDDRIDHWVRLAKHLSPEKQRQFMAPVFSRILAGRGNYGLPPSADLLSLASMEEKFAICQRVLDMLRAIPDPHNLISLTVSFVRSVPDELRQEAMDLLLTWSKQASLTHGFFNLLSVADSLEVLPATEREQLMRNALEGARKVGDPYQRATILTQFIPYLSTSLHQDVIDDAVRHAREVASDEARVRVLARIADQLKGERREELLIESETLANSIPQELVRQKLLSELVDCF